MKYILEKSAVFTFVALKIIVFSALIFVITGCQMSDEEINALVEQRIAELEVQIDKNENSVDGLVVLVENNRQGIRKTSEEHPNFVTMEEFKSEIVYETDLLRADIADNYWALVIGDAKVGDIVADLEAKVGDRVDDLEYELEYNMHNLVYDASLSDLYDGYRVDYLESDVYSITDRLDDIEDCLDSFADWDTGYEGHAHWVRSSCP